MIPGLCWPHVWDTWKCGSATHLVQAMESLFHVSSHFLHYCWAIISLSQYHKGLNRKWRKSLSALRFLCVVDSQFQALSLERVGRTHVSHGNFLYISLLVLPRICLDRWVGFFPFLFFCSGDFPYVIANSFFWGTKVNNWASLVAQLVKNPPSIQETWVWSLGWKDPLKKGKATHSNILVWRISWTVQFMGSERVRHDWATFTQSQ